MNQFDIEESGVRIGRIFTPLLCFIFIGQNFVFFDHAKTAKFNGPSNQLLENCWTKNSFDCIIVWLYLWRFNLCFKRKS